MVSPVQKWENVLISGWKRCFVQTVHFTENSKTWCAQCKNDKKCWSRPENFAEKRWKVVHLVQKWQNVLNLGSKGCFLQTSARCWKSLKGSALSAKWQNVLNSCRKLLFCTNSCTLLKTLKSCVPSAKMTKRADLGLKTLLKSAKK